ncbi:GLUG motif-containing protein [Natrarchaeobius sp. A-rgal3]|uniref:GLUG motif-containing protein n=1 Tax=Natrarchaeobius versutus TaxID=1679078 RepID=UPI0035107669
MLVSAGGVAAETDAPECSEVEFEQNSEGYYEISTLEQLQCVGDDEEGPGLDADYILTEDIDASATAEWNDGAGFEPIGSWAEPGSSDDSEPFTGTFDGDGHVISDLTVNQPDGIFLGGLFGNTEGTISSVGLENVSVTAEAAAGGFVGINRGTITDSYVTGELVAEQDVGGFGFEASGQDAVFERSFAAVDIETDGLVNGGFLAGHSSGTVSDVYATGEIDLPDDFGDHDEDYAGGLIGWHSGGTVENSYWDVAATGVDEGVGTGSDDGITGLQTLDMVGVSATQAMDLDFEDEWAVDHGDSLSYPYPASTEPTAPAVPDSLEVTCDAVEYTERDRSNDFGYEVLLEVGTPTELQCLGHEDSSGTLEDDYLLTNDIDLADTAHWDDGQGFDPIGVRAEPGEDDQSFTGTFDGDGHAISNLTIDRTGQFNALFVAANGTISDVGLEQVAIAGGSSNSAALVAILEEGGAVHGVSASGSVEGDWQTGGLVAIMYEDSEMRNSHTTVDVTDFSGTAGGVAFAVADATIENTYAAGTVSGDESGGIVGSAYDEFPGEYSNVYWDVDATGQDEGLGRIAETDEPATPEGMTGLETWQLTGEDAAEYTELLSEPRWFLPEDDDYPILFWEAADLPAYQAPDCSEVEFEQNSEGYYEIGTLEQLGCVGDDEEGPGLDADYVLIDDIDASDTAAWHDAKGFDPIGDDDEGVAFTGTFDGDGHVISNIVINRPEHGYGTYLGGLFERNDGTITGVGLEDVDITADTNVGGFVGLNDGTITDSYVTGSITAQGSMGGFAMQTMGDGTIERSAAVVDLTGDQWAIGGFIGAHDASWGALNDVYAAGEITLPPDYGDSDSYYAGGIAGVSTASPDIENAYWDVDATGLDDGIGERDDQGVTGLHTPDMVGVSATQAMDLDFEDEWAVKHGDSLSYPYPAMVGLEAPPTPDSLESTCHAIEYAEASDGFLEIRTPMELQCLGHENASGSLEDDYVLMNDIDLADTAHWNDGEGFEPIADFDDDIPYQGTFDGNGHVISNLTIDGEVFVGLFSLVNGTVTDVGVENANVTGTPGAAPLVGDLTEGGTVANSFATGSVDGGTGIGGLVASQRTDTVIRNSHTSADVTGDTSRGSVGGLVGWGYPTIENSYATGSVINEHDEAGEGAIIGEMEPDDQNDFTNVYWDVETTGQDHAIGNDGDDEFITPEGATGLETTAMVGTAAEEHMDVSFGAFWATQTDPDDYPVLFWEAGMAHPTSVNCARVEFEQTDEGVYEVGTLDQLQCIGDDDAGPGLEDDYVLTNDIDAERSQYMNDHTAFAPIGDEDAPFTGSFDGNGHAITELTIEDPDGDGPTGLFAVFDDDGAGHEIHNVSLLEVDVWSDQDNSEHTGGLVGHVEEGALSNVTVTGTVTGGETTGLVAGEVEGSITNVVADGTASGDDHTGLVAGAVDGSITNATATGDVTGDRFTGVVAGEVDGDFQHVSATGTASGGTLTGGAVGELRPADVSNVSADVDVTADGDDDRWIGGLAGRILDGEATQLTATGNVTGTDEVGGLAGSVTGSVTDSIATGDVSGDGNVGGFVGDLHNGEVTTSVATGDVDATGNNAGGFAGYVLGGSVSNSYAQGGVSGGGNAGGFLGRFQSGDASAVYATGAVEDGAGLVGSRNPQTSPEVTDGYWDVEATGQTDAMGVGELEGMTGLETDQFVDVAPAIFAALEYEETWTLVDDDYPALAWEDRAVPATADDPVTIEDSGTYSLHADLVGTGTIFEVAASDVTIDGDDRTLEIADAGGAPAISLSGSDATVSNLTVEHDANATALEVGDAGTTVSNLTANATTGDSVTLSFEGENVAVGATDAPADAPDGAFSAEQYVEATDAGDGELRDLEVAYDPTALSEMADEETLALWKHDGETWHAVDDSSVDTDRQVVTANVTEFSTFGAFAHPPAATLEIGEFGDAFTDEVAGHEYGTVEIPIEETSGEQTIDLDVTLEIVGDETGAVFAETNDTLVLAGESVNASFDVGELDEADTYTATVTADAANADATTRNETFEMVEPATAELSDLEIADASEAATIIEGDDANVSVDATNTGDVAGSFTIDLTIGEEFEASAETDELEPGETETIAFGNVTGDLAPDEYTVSVADAAGDDEQTGTLTVEAPAAFLVSVEETNAPINPGDVLIVTANVTNVGNQTATQTVTLSDGQSDPVDEVELTLAGGESNESVVLEWETDEEDGGTHEVTVASDDSDDTAGVTIYGEATLEVGEFAEQFTDEELGHDYGTVEIPLEETSNETTVDLDVTLEIVGDEAGEVFAETNDTLELAGEETTVEFEVGEIGEGDSYTATVTADADNAGESTRSETFTVTEPPEPAVFEVSDLEPENPTVERGETLDVSAAVTNIGDESAEQPIELRIGGTEITSQTVELDSGESHLVEFTAVETGDLDVGEYEHGIFSDDSSQTGSLTVEADEPERAVLEIGAFDEQFPDETSGYDYGIVEIPIEETAGVDTDGLEISLEVVGDETGEVFAGTNDTLELADEEATVEFDVGELTDADEYTATVTADAENADQQTETAGFTLDVDADSAEFDVEIEKTNSPVKAGETLEVVVNATNLGETTATQTITLTDTGFGNEVRDELDVRLEPGEFDDSVVLTWQTDSEGTGTGDVTVETANESVTETVTVEDRDEQALFEIADLEPETATVEQGEPLDVSATVTNRGDERGEQPIELHIDGDEIANETVALDTDETESVEFTGVETETLEPDSYEHGIFSEDSDQTGTLTVEARAEEAFFAVGDLEPTEHTVEGGETVDVSATVTNVGDETGEQTVELRIDDAEIANRTVELEGEATTTVAFTDVSTTGLGPGSYEYEIASEDSTRTGTLTITSDEPQRAVLEIADFAEEFPDEDAGFEYGSVEITIEEVAGIGTDSLVATLEIVGEDEREVVTETTDVLELDGGGETTIEFDVGELESADTYTVTVTAEAGNADTVIGNHSFTLDDDGTSQRPSPSPSSSTGAGLSSSTDPAEFHLELETEEITTLAGETFDVTTTVENDGDREGTQNLSLLVDAETVDDETRARLNESYVLESGAFVLANESRTLEGGDETTVVFETVSTDGFPDGTYNYTVRTEDDAETGTLTLERPASVEIVETTLPESVGDDEDVTIDVKLRNSGDRDTTRDVDVLVNDALVETASVDLESGDSTTTTLDLDADVFAQGENIVVIDTGDDAVERSLHVESAREADDDSGGTDTVPGFGVGVAIIALAIAVSVAHRRSRKTDFSND